MARIILLLLCLMLAGVYFAVKYLPFWVVAVGALAGLVLIKFVGGWLLKKLFLIPFRAKGAVLHNARVEVHSITPVAPPPPPQRKQADDSEGEEDGREIEANPAFPCYYLIDVSITPTNNEGPFRCWNPEELELIRYGQAYNPDLEEDQRIDGEVVRVEVFGDGGYHPFDGEKFCDSNRFRLLARARPQLRRASYCYYLNTFGDFTLPAAAQSGTAPAPKRPMALKAS